MRKWFQAQLHELGGKPVRYWIHVAIFIGIGLWAGEWIAHQNIWMSWRRSCYHWLHDRVPLKPQPATVLVLIGDEEYWSEELAGRVPISREYLARLVTAVAAESPAVIALDFNLESPSVEGKPIDFDRYAKETNDLVKAISEVPRTSAVVLPKTTRTSALGHYLENSAVYDAHDFRQAKISKGYISLPKDFRKIPLFTMKVQNGGLLDSFSQAIVRAKKPRARLDNPNATLPSSAFVSLEAFTHVSAKDVLNGERKALDELGHNLVIIGGRWHANGHDRGKLIDLHDSPLGLMSGALLHANYVEAILNARLYWEWKPTALRVIEITAAVLLALVFALKTGPFIQGIAVALIVLALVGTSVLSLLAFASVFDFSIPVIIIIGHALVERFAERKKLGTSTE